MEPDETKPFSYLRYSHVAIRAATFRCLEAVANQSGTLDELVQLRDAVETTNRAIAIHAAQEDLGLFPYFDRLADDICARRGFDKEHDEERLGHRVLAQTLELACAGDAEAAERVKTAIESWCESTEEHLYHEEHVLVPLADRFELTREQTCEIVRAMIGSVPPAEADWFVGWLGCQLEAGLDPDALLEFVAVLRDLVDPARLARMLAALRRMLPETGVKRLRNAGFGVGPAD